MHKEIKNFALKLGFDLVRIIPAKPLATEAKHLKDWLQQGFDADMEYMEKNSQARTDPQKILPGAKSIICLGMNYYQKGAGNADCKVARYAFGKDYHKVFEKKLKKIRQFIIEKSQATATKQDFKLYSDAGPVLERGFAVKAGLGFIGKNTTLINKDFGSWIFLAEIITTLKFGPFKVLRDFHGECGSCEKCINACPTKALNKPYELDARKCISYQTIENKGELTVDIKDRAFGCDICQEVCPHNCRAKQTEIPEFTNHIAGPSLNPQEIASMTEEEFKRRFAGSPLKRAGLKGLKRNIQNML
ncbi:tRNA epoxyqueuosine(34) reductase QueG [Patescibacteria group bacterium]